MSPDSDDFQEPFEAVNSRLTIAEIVREPLDIQKLGTMAEREAQVVAALEAVNLPGSPEFMSRYVPVKRQTSPVRRYCACLDSIATLTNRR